MPDRPHVTVSRGRKLGVRARDAHVHYRELAAGEVEDGATSTAVTLIDCLRSLPFPAALAVADSALRVEGCRRLLQQLAELCRGPGSAQVRRVATLASEKKTGPFESALHAIAVDVPGLVVRPQLTIADDGFAARPDLVDTRLRIVLEADSFEWHGHRAALVSDAQRYNALVVRGWLVLRFAYEDVMFHPEQVRRVLLEVVDLAELLGEWARRWSRAA